MIDSRYAMKYPMPHSIVHIIDNSSGVAANEPIVADDPSLYSTLVVTGAPMGEDNKVIKVTRSDVATNAYGLGNITSDDFTKYGQAVEYPVSLISQNVPVQMLRVTPDGSSYGVAILLVQWRIDDVSGKLHIRYATAEVPADLILNRISTKEKLNAAIVRAYNNTTKQDANGTQWHQGVIATYISAGRGRIYNNFNVAINYVAQNKRPANVKYEFVTIDKRTSSVVEKFYASLINENNNLRTDAIETANNLVSKRVEGSSIVVPFINEAIVKKLYTEYKKVLKNKIDTASEVSDTVLFDKKVYNYVTANTFDIFYGNYIYEGSDSESKLPYLQLEMLDTNIKRLDSDNLLEAVVADPSTYTDSDPAVLYTKLTAVASGITASGCSSYIGDLYLTDNGKPMISIIAGINQFSGNITYVTIPKIKALTSGSYAATSDYIAAIVRDDIATSSALKKLVESGDVKVGSVVAQVVSNKDGVAPSFKLYTVLTATASTGAYTVGSAYTKQQIRLALDWASHPSGESGVGNIIGRSSSDSAFNRIGATVIDSNGDVYVNDWNLAVETSFSETGRKKITNDKCVFGDTPTEVKVQSDLIGQYFDVLVYKTPKDTTKGPDRIERYLVAGVQGSIFRVSHDPIVIPANYYSSDTGINMSSELGGIAIERGSTGFFDKYDDGEISLIEYKWKYSALLVKAFRGLIDPKIMSPTRVPAKYLFDAGYNTIVGQTIMSYIKYDPADIIAASTIFTADEKDEVIVDREILASLSGDEDIDVKQAMYDLMDYRVYQGIPEEKRPEGPGSGLELNLDACVSDANTALLMNTSFAKRFSNPNASWDIGGWTDMSTGRTYTYVKRIVDNLFTHMKQRTVNKPFVGEYSTIRKSEYISYFPDIDTTDWELRELMYNSGGNVWVVDINGNLSRRSQRTLYRESESSDIIQESNMRTLSQLVYLIQNDIDKSLLEYDDDGVLKTLQDKINTKFAPWIGSLVQKFNVSFQRDKNTDGGDLLVCYINVTFRGLILRVPIIVNVNARTN